LLFDEGSIVKITAYTGAGAVFESWDGACSGTGAACSIRLGGSRAVTARYKQGRLPWPPEEIVFDAQDVSRLAGPCAVTDAQVLGDTGAMAGYCYYDRSSWDVFLWDGALHRFQVPKDTLVWVKSTAGGRVAGTLQTASRPYRAYVTDAQRLVELPTLGGVSEGIAINASGVVVGMSVTPSGEQHAVAWRNGVLDDLGARTGKAGSVAMAIDESGNVGVLACDQLQPTAGCRALVMTDQALTDMGSVSDGATVYAMNADGQLVGYAMRPARPWLAIMAAQVWANGETMDLSGEISARAWPRFGSIEGLLFDSRLVAVAASGDAIGQVILPNSEGAASTALLWKDGKVVDLARAVDPPMPLFTAYAINAKGQILARRGEYGGIYGGEFLLTPH
jgi:probable HAF family extracellular repeat protein